MKTIVTKTNGSWQLEQIEDGKIFDDNMKAVRFFEKKIEEKKKNGSSLKHNRPSFIDSEHTDFLSYLQAMRDDDDN